MKMLGEKRDSSGVQVIARAASILRCLSKDGMSLGALAKATGLPRSTVQRIVDALAAENLVEAGSGGVRPGWGLQQLAQLAYSEIAHRARPALEELFEKTHETVDISMTHGQDVTFLDRIVSDQELRVVPAADRVHALHAMANGKAMLSLMNDETIASLLRGGMPRLTAATHTSIDNVLKEIADVRRTGFSFDREENRTGVCAIGTPISIAGLRPHAVSVVAPSFRFDTNLKIYQEGLIECRRSIEGIFRDK